MLDIIKTENRDVYKKVEKLLSLRIGEKVEILKTESGKPYINYPLFFSISHCEDRAYIAICDKPVGIDFEIIQGRNFSSTLNRFTKREREEISNSEDKFLINWTVKEAYIKLYGYTLAKYLKKLEYVGRKLYLKGVQQNVTIDTKIIGDEIITVCT